MHSSRMCTARLLTDRGSFTVPPFTEPSSWHSPLRMAAPPPPPPAKDGTPTKDSIPTPAKDGTHLGWHLLLRMAPPKYSTPWTDKHL